MQYELALDANEVSLYLKEIFPQADQYGFEIENLAPGKARIRMPISDEHLRPGGSISGPNMFALADCSAYILLLAHKGKIALIVTTQLNINFMNKPALADLIAEVKLLKLGKRLAVCEISIFSSADEKLVAHATATYSIPPQNNS